MMSQAPPDPLSHVLAILGDEVYALIFKEAGIETIEDLWLCDFSELKSLATLIGSNHVVTSLNLVQVGKLTRILEWFEEQETDDMDIWYNLTTNDLKKTFKSKSTKVTAQNTPVINPNSLGILSGVRRSLTDYPKLREDKMWLSYNRTLLALAASHDLSEIFKPTYVPPPHESQEFQRKNIFVYSMFTYSLISAKAKVALRAHEHTLDGQKVYADLLTAYSDGTSATLCAETLETQLRGMKLDNTWTKPTETFLHTWSTRLYDLEAIRDDTISIADKKRWLTNSIKPHSNLYQGINTAKSVEHTMKACAGGLTMTWEQFFNLILDHAQHIDSTVTKRVQKAHATTQQRGNTNKPKTPSHNSSQSNTTNRRHANYIAPEKWAVMSKEEKKKVHEARRQKRGVNTTNRTATPTPAGTDTTTEHTAPPTDNNPTPTPTLPAAPQLNTAQRFLNQASVTAPRTIVIDGVTYTANTTNITYHAHRSQSTHSPPGSLVDRGANGGFSGDDVVVLASSTSQFADVKGIADASVTNVPLCTVAGVLTTTTGPIIGIFHQYAHYGQGHTLHSPLQLEAFGIDVLDHGIINRPKQQRIETPDGHTIPLNVHGGLVYMPMRKPTPQELTELTHVIITADEPWDPSNYNNTGHTYYPIREEETKVDDELFTLSASYEANEMACILACSKADFHISLPKSILPKNPNYEKLRPVFGWIPPTRIKDTLKHTTQYYKAEG